MATNKAHKAVLRRIAARYGAAIDQNYNHIVLPDGLVQVETSATLAAGIDRLQQESGRRFIAVTNKETLADALALVAGTSIGVMNSFGDIIRPAQ